MRAISRSRYSYTALFNRRFSDPSRRHRRAHSSPSSSLSSPSMNASDIFAFFCIEIVVPLLTLGVPPTLLNVPGSPMREPFYALPVMCEGLSGRHMWVPSSIARVSIVTLLPTF